MLKKVLVGSLVFLFIGSPLLQAATSEHLPIPRFASLRSAEVNLRRGPGTQYPLDWVYVRAGLPVMIISEFETWRKIRDVEGAEGWVHQSMLSGRRTAMIPPARSIVSLRASSDHQSSVVAVLEPGAQGAILSCKGAWCKLQFESHKGWLNRDQFWGVRDHEEIK